MKSRRKKIIFLNLLVVVGSIETIVNLGDGFYGELSFDPKDVTVAFFFIISALIFIIQLVLLPRRIYKFRKSEFADEHTIAKNRLIAWIIIFTINCVAQSIIWWYIANNWI